MHLLLLLPLLFGRLLAEEEKRWVDLEALAGEHRIVLSTKQIVLESYPGAYNPSLIRFEEKYLLSFRYSPDPYGDPWTSYIGVVLLNEDLEPVSEPEILNTRTKTSRTHSHAEDARFFTYRGKTMVIYNDNVDAEPLSYHDRRDMFIAQLKYEEGSFSLTPPRKLIHREKYGSCLWQKNWAPFEWNRTLLIAYSVSPHEILSPNLISGECYRCFETDPSLCWNFGHLKLSSPPIATDGEYLSFFHSWKVLASDASSGADQYHYFIGAYVFSRDPPFEITHYTPSPIVGEGFYTQSSSYKRVVFPGSFIVAGSTILLPYGKDDEEIWVAAIDREALKNAMVPVE